MGLLKLVEDWVKKNYKGSEHLLRTGYWLKRLNPRVDQASMIAAISHDIERAFEEGRTPPISELADQDWANKDYNIWHGKRSAEFVGKFLAAQGVRANRITEIKRLITYHELGGDKDTDLIKDADSLSFLEVNAPFFISLIPQKALKRDVKRKFDYMFKRISSKEAQLLAKPLYQQALVQLAAIP